MTYHCPTCGSERDSPADATGVEIIPHVKPITREQAQFEMAVTMVNHDTDEHGRHLAGFNVEPFETGQNIRTPSIGAFLGPGEVDTKKLKAQVETNYVDTFLQEGEDGPYLAVEYTKYQDGDETERGTLHFPVE